MTLVLNTERSQLRDVLHLLAETGNNLNIVINLGEHKQVSTNSDFTALSTESIRDYSEPAETGIEESELPEKELPDEPQRDFLDLTTEDLELIEQEIDDPVSAYHIQRGNRKLRDG